MYRLRPMEATDRDLVLSWRNDPRVRVNMYTHHEISADEHQRWFDLASRDPAKRLLICVDNQGTPAGVVIFSDINREHRSATWAFYSGSNARGIGSEMERLALDFAFQDLELEKLNCEVLSFNMPVVAFHRKHGFRVEGVFRSHYLRDGVRYDVYRLAQFRRAWLEEVRPNLVRAGENRGERLRVGATHREKVRLTHGLVAQFATITGDRNGAHLDDAAARAAGFDGVLAQGMLVAAGFSKILATSFPGPGITYVNQSLQFRRPVYPDCELEYTLKVISIIGKNVILATSADMGGESLVTGEAEIILPPPASPP